MPRSAQPRQRGSSILPRHSMAQMRRIIESRITSSGRYRPENKVAYIPGKAANIAPPAVISHTSLPSQTGPMVLSTARVCCSRSPVADAAKGFHQHADPEVETLEHEEAEEERRQGDEPEVL